MWGCVSLSRAKPLGILSAVRSWRMGVRHHRGIGSAEVVAVTYPALGRLPVSMSE